MAALSPAAMLAASHAACAEARILRSQSKHRRFELRRTLALARERYNACAATSLRVQRTRELRFRSAWSDLFWQLPDERLDRVLVPHDREA